MCGCPAKPPAPFQQGSYVHDPRMLQILHQLREDNLKPKQTPSIAKRPSKEKKNWSKTPTSHKITRQRPHPTFLLPGAARKFSSAPQLPSHRLTFLSHRPEHLETKKHCWLCRWKHRGEGVSKHLAPTRWACTGVI
jgi:hypothetical protein